MRHVDVNLGPKGNHPPSLIFGGSLGPRGAIQPASTALGTRRSTTARNGPDSAPPLTKPRRLGAGSLDVPHQPCPVPPPSARPPISHPMNPPSYPSSPTRIPFHQRVPTGCSSIIASITQRPSHASTLSRASQRHKASATATSSRIEPSPPVPVSSLPDRSAKFGSPATATRATPSRVKPAGALFALARPWFSPRAPADTATLPLPLRSHRQRHHHHHALGAFATTDLARRQQQVHLWTHRKCPCPCLYPLSPSVSASASRTPPWPAALLFHLYPTSASGRANARHFHQRD